MLGFISDIEMDTQEGRLTSIIIFGKVRFMGLLGHEEDIVIPWEDIEVIGSETVLVNTEPTVLLQENGKKLG